jgi:DNA-directed RNA polymerase subunit RPC12/RpoP
MALIQCGECQREVSDSAIICPACGYPLKIINEKKPPRKYGCGTLILLFVVAAIVKGGYDQASAPPPAPLTRTQQIESQFSSWNGAHRNLEETVKARLKDPDSYEHIETRYTDRGDYISVYMKYRAKNGFGGYVVETAVANCTLAGACTSPR